MKVTQWFNHHEKPVNLGWYESQNESGMASHLRWWWDGVWRGSPLGNECWFQYRVWRGIAK